MKYTMQILDDREFDRLPYPEMETSLGVADPRTNTAFVRRTGIKPMDTFTAMHELEHLEEGGKGKHANHYRNGVYYKGFGDVMGTILPIAASFIPGAGAVAGPAVGAAMGATKNLGFDTQAPKGPEAPQTPTFNMPQTPQVSAPAVSQAQTPGGAAGTSPTGSAMNMESLRRMLSSGAEVGRSPQDPLSQMFGMGQGTGRMA